MRVWHNIMYNYNMLTGFHMAKKPEFVGPPRVLCMFISTGWDPFSQGFSYIHTFTHPRDRIFSRRKRHRTADGGTLCPFFPFFQPHVVSSIIWYNYRHAIYTTPVCINKVYGGAIIIYEYIICIMHACVCDAGKNRSVGGGRGRGCENRL